MIFYIPKKHKFFTFPMNSIFINTVDEGEGEGEGEGVLSSVVKHTLCRFLLQRTRPLKIAEVTSQCLYDEVSKETVDACSFLPDS